ncbi:hypothetical protein OF83DRAFT_1052332 [Amylostereum chailletii]|nr:hypothetical protein OF83DRAFT_1052332 [Amylostereum chailletii]
MPSFAAVFGAFRMLPSKFNLLRACIYSLVILWSIVCLAIAAHFQSILSASDLTRFVPFALFVSSASLAVMFALLAFSIRKTMNPVTTRIELACLGLVGTFWIALGAFLASSDSETADVECFTSASETDPIDGGFSTETYQAQYRVLEAFSLFNAILVWAFLIVLFILAIRHYLAGNKDVWLTPVTTFAWFGKDAKQPDGRLPAPVTSRNAGRSRDTALTPAPKRHTSEKDAQRNAASAAARRNYGDESYFVWIPERKDSTRTTATERKDSTRTKESSRTYESRGSDKKDIGRFPERHVSIRVPERGAGRAPERNDSRRTAPERSDSRRTAPERSDSRRTAPERSDSRRTAPERSDSRRTMERRDSTRAPERNDSGRSRGTTRPERAHTSSRGQIDYYRRDVSPRR